MKIQIKQIIISILFLLIVTLYTINFLPSANRPWTMHADEKYHFLVLKLVYEGQDPYEALKSAEYVWSGSTSWPTGIVVRSPVPFLLLKPLGASINNAGVSFLVRYIVLFVQVLIMLVVFEIAKTVTGNEVAALIGMILYLISNASGYIWFMFEPFQTLFISLALLFMAKGNKILPGLSLFIAVLFKETSFLFFIPFLAYIILKKDRRGLLNYITFLGLSILFYTIHSNLSGAPFKESRIFATFVSSGLITLVLEAFNRIPVATTVTNVITGIIWALFLFGFYRLETKQKAFYGLFLLIPVVFFMSIPPPIPGEPFYLIRYTLPIFPVISILASLGLTTSLQNVKEIIKKQVAKYRKS